MTSHILKLTLFFSLALALPAAAATPVIFWASDPVRPGEVVLVQGGNWGPGATVEITVPPDGKPLAVTPLSLRAADLKFLLPADLPAGVCSCRVAYQGQVPAPFFLNAPDPWWPRPTRSRSSGPSARCPCA